MTYLNDYYHQRKEVNIPMFQPLSWSSVNQMYGEREKKIKYGNDKRKLITTTKNNGMKRDNTDVKIRCSDVYNQCQEFNIAQEKITIETEFTDQMYQFDNYENVENVEIIESDENIENIDYEKTTH